LGRLRVGAAVGVHDYQRAESLIGKGVDVIVVDSAHGHSANVLETVQEVKRQWDIDVIAGNVATREGAEALIRAGVDAVKVASKPAAAIAFGVLTVTTLALGVFASGVMDVFGLRF